MRMTPEQLLRSTPPERRGALIERMSDSTLEALARELRGGVDPKWARYRNDPVGFVTHGLGENVWSKQIEILQSVRDNKRTAVPACHAPGKSHIAARAIAWWISVHAPETVRVVTTATTFRQVRGILWPHIRRLHAAHHLPGEVLTTEWKIDDILVADGFSPADHNETAVQGIHAENLLVVVDEAGGISPIIGNAIEALMTGGHTRLLLLGNPPTDSIGSWFERACNSDLYNVIPIDAYSTPNFTGEVTGEWVKNLVDAEWVRDVIKEFGEESPFVQARVHARFPRTTTNVTLPIDWLESAVVQEPVHEGTIRLGVDVAADGGDEFVIAQADGMCAHIVHASSHNDNAVAVAGTVLNVIHKAQEAHATRGITERIRVKIDSIGVGWGVTSLLKEWGDEGRHTAEVIAVNVAERAYDNEKFANQRAEMWWNLRTLIQPDENGKQDVTLAVDRKAIAQLTAPTYRANSSGRLQIESKADMKRRGVSSPDRAEALLLALFEPPRKEPILAPPLSITQTSGWI
jgi:hypothetical protein